MTDLAPGLTATRTLTVAGDHTASTVGSGDVPALATPSLVALAEAACVAAVQEALPDGATSVGTRVELDHTRASAIGATVEAHATLTGVEGRTLTFEVVVRDGDHTVATVHHQRAVVDRARFLARLQG